ncbi:hypothetical protein EVG20_g10712 [Dentipellis fragilis]|uniref:Uncharacterized protein n=1 Tax=Dentipellis fragilis TaxID=205917 RepID=A0A4Y9XQN9_9AGAM|nr:hypothetical protein EVG20_g10712 [Dentipellis fragilis]
MAPEYWMREGGERAVHRLRTDGLKTVSEAEEESSGEEGMSRSRRGAHEELEIGLELGMDRTVPAREPEGASGGGSPRTVTATVTRNVTRRRHTRIPPTTNQARDILQHTAPILITMSLARAALHAARPKHAVVALAQCRLASSDSHAHDEHHHAVDAHHDTTQYPQEGFTSSGWLYTVVGGLALVGFYKFAPSSEEDNIVSRYISHYRTPAETWEHANNKHLQLSAELQDSTLVLQHAVQSPVRRMRFPQALDMASPFNVPVGLEVDVSHVKAKTDSAL